ncbi:glycosyltransferase [Caballeronia sp. LZ065]|uniref:glycosyltransferase n=1 Tax=Caballeronia sp. LZ065 TaxID=3038571 RepID=UPI002864C112|nr:glycosyltransferase [Caballeronia sp. LZ065]MDR5784044.1 glycosyltransferase [Caballeronia sp. LZ065]
MKLQDTARIAVLVPCYNEATTITSVVKDFKAALPNANVYVFDNNSTDDTVARARDAGATVRRVGYQGKGNVIRRMFADVDADAYVLVDGDDTYDATAAPALVEALFTEGLDMIVGARKSDEREAYRLGHRLGNKVLTRCVATVFGRTFSDMLSGYRVFSRRYVKSYPAHAAGFETETELTVHALELRMPVAEIETRYKSRPAGSTSKLNTYRDGWRILLTIIKLFKTERPLLFFSCGLAACAVASTLLALPLLRDYFITGLVPRLPTAVLCAALMLLGFVLLTCGIVLDTVTHGRREVKRQAYLDQPAPSVDLNRFST